VWWSGGGGGGGGAGFGGGGEVEAVAVVLAWVPESVRMLDRTINAPLT